MHVQIGNKLCSTIISLLFLIYCATCLSDDDFLLEDCETWKESCNASLESSNKYFRCYVPHEQHDRSESVILFYDPNQVEKSWDEARKTCAIRFNGSPLADLVQLTDKKKVFVEMMLRDIDKDKDKIKDKPIATDGVCCNEKLSTEDNHHVVSTECQWLSTKENMSDSLIKERTENKCKIYTVKFDGNKLTDASPMDKSTANKMAYICGFNLPEHCDVQEYVMTEKPTTTTEPSTSTSERTTQSTAPPIPPKTDPPSNTDPTKEPVTTESSHHDTTSSEPDTTIGMTSSSTSSSNHTHIDHIDHDLEHISKDLEQDNIDSVDLVAISKKLKYILNSCSQCEIFPEKFSNESLQLTMQIIDKLEHHFRNIKDQQLFEFSDNIVESCSRVLDFELAWDSLDRSSQAMSDTRTRMGSSVLEYMQKTGFRMNCVKQNSTVNRRIDKPNIVIESIATDYNTVIHFSVNESSVTVPEGIPQPDIRDECVIGTAVGSVFDKLSRFLSDHLDNQHKINSNIVAFSMTNTNQSMQLPDNVTKIKVVVKHNRPLEFGDSVQCVFWNHSEEMWSSYGCQYEPIGSSRMVSICQCNHLTNFAALMDVSGRQTNTRAKDILTKVCSGLSIVCLTITIGLMSLVRTLRNRRSNITCNLCLCLLVVNLLVVFGMDRIDNKALCQSVAGLLLYFLLASFSWMLMEGYHLYQMIVLVFTSVGHLKLIYLYGIGYGAPLLISLTAMLGIGFNDLTEADSYFCWISTPFHPYRVWAVAGPGVFVIMANTLIMFLALKEAYSAKSRKKFTEKKFNDDTGLGDKLSESLAWIKGFLALLFLLGITWITFILYIQQYGDTFSYFFIIFNGLQGVFIFTFQILLNSKARSSLAKSCPKKVSRLGSRYLSSIVRTTSTNVFTSVHRTKSNLSREKSSNTTNTSEAVLRGDALKGTTPVSTAEYPKHRRASGDKNATISSHRSQSISMNRIRNASDSILF